MFSGRRLRVERISLIVGFVLSIAGIAASQLYQQPSTDRLQATARNLDETWAQLKIIHDAQALLGLLQSFEGLRLSRPGRFLAQPAGGQCGGRGHDPCGARAARGNAQLFRPGGRGRAGRLWPDDEAL